MNGVAIFTVASFSPLLFARKVKYARNNWFYQLNQARARTHTFHDIIIFGCTERKLFISTLVVYRWCVCVFCSSGAEAFWMQNKTIDCWAACVCVRAPRVSALSLNLLDSIYRAAATSRVNTFCVEFGCNLHSCSGTINDKLTLVHSVFSRLRMYFRSLMHTPLKIK